MSTISENVFIQQLNNKSSGAFEDLYKYFYAPMILLARQKLQDQAAEDVVQEVFISIWEAPKQFNSYHGFRTYLYNSVVNRCLDFLKHERVHDSYVAYAQLHDEYIEEEYDLQREKIYQDLYLALERLPLRCREVFKMCLEGVKYEEIARMLSITVATVKNHKKKAISFLKQELGNDRKHMY